MIHFRPSSLRLPILLSAIFCTSIALARADSFTPWWQAFQAAVAHDDKAAVASMIVYPAEWENLEVRSIPSKVDFLARYPRYFTGEIKNEIAHAKPAKIPTGYTIDWKGSGNRAANSYSIAFKEQGNGKFIVEGLYEGPRD